MSALFYSETPCFLKQNGNIVLNINKNLTLLNVTENDFLEFIPKNNLYLPTYFYKNYNTMVKTFNVFLLLPSYETTLPSLPSPSIGVKLITLGFFNESGLFLIKSTFVLS